MMHGWMKQSPMLYVLMIVLLGILLLAACGSGDSNNSGQTQNGQTINQEESATSSEGTNQSEQANEGDVTDSYFPITVTDDGGNEVTIETQPERIVTLIPSITESAFALGLGDQIVGVSDFDNYPQQASELTKVGSQDINAEVLLSLEPDMALVTVDHQFSAADMLDEFRDVGITVVVVDYSATSFDDVYQQISLIAEVTGKVEEAQELIADMQSHLEQLQAKAGEIQERRKVFVEVSNDPIFTTGTNTFMHEMLEAIGAQNAAEEVESWAQFSEEEILALAPDVIITTYGYYIDDPKGIVMSRAGWEEVPAIVHERIHDVDSDMVTRTGPRVIDGLELLAQAIYPDVFVD